MGELNQDIKCKVYQRYEKGKDYLTQLGIAETIPRYVEFYEGNQWGTIAEGTENLPRPVFNFIKMIINNKVSNIVGSPVKLNYVAYDNRIATNQFTRFAHFQCKRMGMDSIDFEAVLQGRIKGTFVKHYYWSEEERGRKGRYKGDLKCQLIDPLCVFVADPSEKDVQKQKWIIVATREEVSKIKEMCDTKERRELITKDDKDTFYQDTNEMDDSDSELATLLTMYIKKDGEVYYQKATKTTELFDPIPLNPYLVNKMKNKHIEEDGKISSTPDEKLEQQDTPWQEDYYMASYYPIEICSLEPRDGCIYGLSEIKDMVVAQKLVNFNIAMGALNLQELGAPKILEKRGALEDQVVTNEPGQRLTDNTPGNFWGVKTLEVTPFSAQALQFAPSLIELIRMVSNATEVITGEMVSKDLSGYAIAQLQQQAQKPIEMQRKRFWQHKEREGKILEMFYKLYYEKEPYFYQLNVEERITHYEQNGIMPKEQAQGYFNGVDYQDIEFSVIVEAGAGTQYSEVQSMHMLDNLLQAQLIDLKTYVELYPESAMPFKAEMKEFVYLQDKQELNQIKQIAQQQAQMIEQLSQQVDEKDEFNKSILRELKTNEKLMQQLQNEYSAKISEARQIIGALQGNQEPKKEDKAKE